MNRHDPHASPRARRLADVLGISCTAPYNSFTALGDRVVFSHGEATSEARFETNNIVRISPDDFGEEDFPFPCDLILGDRREHATPKDRLQQRSAIRDTMIARALLGHNGKLRAVPGV